MKQSYDEKLDEYFREAFASPEISFDEENWLIMQRKLEKRNKQGYFYWGLALGSAAALCFITLTLWLSGTAVLPKSAIALVKRRPDAQTVTATAIQPLHPSFQPQSSTVAITTAIGKQAARGTGTVQNIRPATLIAQGNPVNAEELRIPATSQVPVTAFAALSPVEQLSVVSYSGDEDTARRNTAVTNRFKPAVTLGLSLSPDFNGVNSLNGSKKGFSGGITATVSFSPKFSFTTGVLLSRKLYETGFSNYKPNSTYKFPIEPLSIGADCRVIDLPVNLSYTFLNRSKNSLSAIAGTSSYLMLKEDYSYSYASPVVKGPKQYEVKNQNKHFLGVGNIGIAYARKLSPVVGLAFEPYAKIPLTPIGYGNVKLFSAGAAVHLYMHLSQLSPQKP